MYLNANGIGPSIVLASILAGFGLSFAVQLARSPNGQVDHRPIAVEFIKSSLLCLLALFIGIVFSIIRSETIQALPIYGTLRLAMISIANVLLLVALWRFLRGVGKLATELLGLEPHWVAKYLTKAFLTVVVVAAVVLILGILAWRYTGFYLPRN